VSPVPLLVPHSQAVLVPPLPVLPPSAARLPYHLLRPLVSPHHGKPRVRLCPSLPLLTIHALLGRYDPHLTLHTPQPTHDLPAS
jgi:hypothetical protein